MLSPGTTSDVLAACQVLFGPDVDVSREFLEILQPSGVKAAFRRRVRETHPDLHAADPVVQQRQALLFQEVTAAYSRVACFCERRHDRQGSMARPFRSKTSSRDVGASPQEGHYYTGEVPYRQMLIGRYLYYRCIIPYHMLLEALSWQRRQRPTIGRLARDWGWLSEQGVTQVLASFTRFRGRFGERACQLGLLSPFQVKQLLRAQQTSQRQLGQFFVQKGYLTQAKLATLLVDMSRHNNSLSAI